MSCPCYLNQREDDESKNIYSVGFQTKTNEKIITMNVVETRMAPGTTLIATPVASVKHSPVGARHQHRGGNGGAIAGNATTTTNSQIATSATSSTSSTGINANVSSLDSPAPTRATATTRDGLVKRLNHFLSRSEKDDSLLKRLSDAAERSNAEQVVWRDKLAAGELSMSFFPVKIICLSHYVIKNCIKNTLSEISKGENDMLVEFQRIDNGLRDCGLPPTAGAATSDARHRKQRAAWQRDFEARMNDTAKRVDAECAQVCAVCAVCVVVGFA